MRAGLFLTLLVGLTAPALAQEAVPRLARDMDYAQARRTLQSRGWAPVRLPGADRCPSGDERCEGRPEMFSCAGTGLAACVFTWRRNATVIEVHTIGEGAPGVRTVRCRSGCR
jgi:hypothetical protein